MSTVNTVNTVNTFKVTEYTAGITKATTGSRLAVLYWKTGKDGIKRDSKAVQLPVLAALSAEELQAMMPHCLEMLATVQNKIVRSLVEAGGNSISEVDISVAKCMEWLESTTTDSNGQTVRLTKESIGEWFTARVADSLMLALAAKLGVSEEPTLAEAKLVEDTLAAFKSRVVSLAGGATKLDVKTATSVANALKVVEGVEDDAIGAKLLARLEVMKNPPKTIDLIDLL